jgi:hypothetical protein
MGRKAGEKTTKVSGGRRNEQEAKEEMYMKNKMHSKRNRRIKWNKVVVVV